MKWMLIVLIYQYNDGMVEKSIPFDDQIMCEYVAGNIKDDLKKAISLEGKVGNGYVSIVTSCSRVG